MNFKCIFVCFTGLKGLVITACLSGISAQMSGEVYPTSVVCAKHYVIIVFEF